MAHQLNIFFLLLGAVQGVLVSVFLLRNVRKEISQLFLIMFLTVVGLQLTFKVISKLWLWDHARGIYHLSYSLPYLAAPLLYWFVRTRLTDQQIRPRHAIHFLPFAVSFLLIFLTQIMLIPIVPVLGGLLRDDVACVLQLINLLAFARMAYLMISASSSPVTNGLQQFVRLVVVCEAVIIIAIALLHHYYGSMPDLRFLFLSLTVMIYWISYKLVSYPHLFIPIHEEAPLTQMKPEPASVKYSHSGLRPEEAERIVALLHNVMHKEKLYLNTDLTVDALAASLRISRHHLSQVLNERIQKSYFDFVTHYRLEESRTRLAENKYNHFTIAAIALDSGFTSVSSFNEAFKKQYNTTPSKFRSQARRQMSA